jgi:aspartyl-tRNA(Asn)/glutamyl-tRNA(Gln) amidotransferase subunit A
VTEIPTIAEAAALIAQRKLSPVELTQSHLQRIELLDPAIHAFLLVTGERALGEAKAAEAEIMANGPKGPLHGIPIAHKDIYCTKGIRTTGHSRVLIDHVPQEDATTVARLAEAGTVMLGKLATHEFAWGGPSFDLPWPPARNPWDLRRFTGGSSSGTAAAVAAGLILGGTGSDTGGSIRLPASYCGVTGFKPTYGLCPRTGILPLAYSLDHAGPLAWTVEDCAILLQAMAGHDPRDPASADVPVKDYRRGLEGRIAGLRIGFVRRFHETDMKAGEETRRALENAAEVFRGLGAELREVALPSLEDWTACGMIIMMTEAYALHEPWLRTRMGEYGEFFRDRVVFGAFLRGSDYVEAQRLRRELCTSFDTAMRDCDLLLCAITPGGAPLFEEMTKMSSFERPSFSFPFNVTGSPALALRGGFTEDGLPLGIQLAGRPFEDEVVLRAGHAYERATSWSRRRPPQEPPAS